MNQCKFQQLHSLSISAFFLTAFVPANLFIFLILCGFHLLLAGFLGNIEELEGREELVRLLSEDYQLERSSSPALLFKPSNTGCGNTMSFSHLNSPSLLQDSFFLSERHLIFSIFLLIHDLVSNYSNYSCFMSAISFQYLSFSKYLLPQTFFIFLDLKSQLKFTGADKSNVFYCFQ